MQRGRGVQFPHNQESGSVKAHSLPESDRSLTSTIMYVCMRACASSQNKNVQSVVECAIAPNIYT